jgi:nicotinamidase-related amidase
MGQFMAVTGLGQERLVRGNSVMPWAAPAAGELVVVKHTWDAFLGTPLEAELRGRGKRRLVFAGVATSCCVLFSVVGATLRGFNTAVVTDACAEPDVAASARCLEQFGQYAFHSLLTANFLDFVRGWKIPA